MDAEPKGHDQSGGGAQAHDAQAQARRDRQAR